MSTVTEALLLWIGAMTLLFFLYVDVSSCLSVMLTTELAKLKDMAGGSQSSSHTAKASRPATEHRGLFIVGYLAKAVRQ